MTVGAGRFHVACAVVGDYLPHAAAMLASLVERGGEREVTVHLLHDGRLTTADLRAVEAMLVAAAVELRTYIVDDEQLAGVPTAGFTGKGSWYRVFLPELAPDVERVLYLDVDLLVLDSLSPLRLVDLSHAYVGAVSNVFEPAHVGRPAALGLEHAADYFNAGVLLMNLDAMRRDDSTHAVLAYARANARTLRLRDQDALNVVLGEGHVRLHPRWNCMNSIIEFGHSVDVFGADQVEEARASPAIRHFEGPALNKPWHYLADPAMQRLYAHHRRSTPWPRVELDDRTPATRLLRRLPRSVRRRAYVQLARHRVRCGAGLRP